MRVEMVKIDLKTGERVELYADVANEQDTDHKIYSLTYEGYRTEWKVEGK